jgi:acyl-CoA thioesterase I
MASELFRYVALGDSSGVGVGASVDGGYPERVFQRLRASGVNAGILNLAQSGATTREVVAQVSNAASKRPALVTLGVGTNDLWRMVPIGTFEMNLKLIADGLAKSGASVVVSNIIDLSMAPIAVMVETLLRIPKPMFTRRVEEMNARIGALAKRPGFTLVDLFAFSRQELPAHPEYFCPDGFHPSGAGYDRWAELMWPAVEAAAKNWAKNTAS